MFAEIGLTHLLLMAALLIALVWIRQSIPGSGLRAWHERHASLQAEARWHRVLLLELTELVLAAIFVLVGGGKLVGRPDMVALFREIGVGQWFRYVTGVIELTGAALLVIPALSRASAVALGCVMIVATLIELFVLRRPPFAALGCLTGHAYVAWARASGHHRPTSTHGSVSASLRSHAAQSIGDRWRLPKRGRRAVTSSGHPRDRVGQDARSALRDEVWPVRRTR